MNIADEKPRHCLSFDIEEHFQVSAFESPIRRRRWAEFESRVERNTNKLLDLLADRHVHATFFVLGWVAERHPGLVRRIREEGHEVASHGYAHERVTVQTPRTFREDVRRAKRVLEDILSLKVQGYRAPSFSITCETMWALPILVEEGYAYDSSLFPALPGRSQVLGKNQNYQKITTSAGTLWEIPLSTVRVFGVRVPVAGGGYFRLFPYALLHQLLKKVERTGSPLVMYLHPWELDPDQPRMNGPLISQFRHYLNLHKTESRLNSLLEDFSFGPIQKVIGPIAHLWHEQADCGISNKNFVEVSENPTSTLSLSAKAPEQVSG